MKHFLIITLTLFFCLAVYAVNNDDKFLNALKNCSAYQESGTVNVQGISAKSSKKISGWTGDKCTYNENINFNEVNTNITCKFSRKQIDEIATVTDAYFTTLKYSNTKPDTSSLKAVENNPVINVFNKYLQDPSVCSISGIDK